MVPFLGYTTRVIVAALTLVGMAFFVANLDAEKRTRDPGILLVPVGKVEDGTLEILKTELGKFLNKPISTGQALPEPDYAFSDARRQYWSTAILKTLLGQREYSAFEKVLGIVDHDLYVPELNFVFGEASLRAAVISLTRLRQSFYGSPEDSGLFHRRVLTEAVHELGHTYGLGHCENPRCVMFFSNRLSDTDRKGPGFCSRCRSRFSREK